MRRIILAISSSFLAVMACAQDVRGSITVRVLDQLGNPVPGATVEFGPPPGRMLLYSSPTCKTDASGQCTRGRLALDRYFVRAMKAEDGYPDISFEFYSHETKPASGHPMAPVIVDLSPDHPTANISFTLGQKAGTVKLNVIDAQTGLPIDSYTVVLHNIADPKDFLGIGKTQNSTILIPD
jgi:hypothetical protein